MQDFEPLAEGSSKQFAQEHLEVSKAPPGVTAREGQTSGHQQATEQLYGSHPPIAIGDLYGVAGDSGFGLMETLPGLDRSFLIHTAQPLLPGRQLLRVLIEIQHWSGFLHKVRISRVLPGVVAPGLDLILPQPAANGAGRDSRDDALFHGHLGQFLARPALPHFAVSAGLATGQGDNLRPHQGREVARGARAGGRL
jgi:hypothetical protein